MKSPLTGKEMELVYEQRTWIFRGEEYQYTHASWLCLDSGEKFTTDETDNAAFSQVTNQYRVKYGIPFTDEIIQIRKRYGISASKMSKLLGFGINQWRLYEAGEVPSVSNGRTIRSIETPAGFLNIVISAKNIMEPKDYQKIMDHLNKLMVTQESLQIEKYKKERIFKYNRSYDNGFGVTSVDKIKNILLYILNECGETFQTKMNKILFYADFLSYRQYGISICGLSYIALEYGPVPEHWDRIYSQFDEIAQEQRVMGEKEGVILKATEQPDITTLSGTEQQILQTICKRFKNTSSAEISRISHNEPAWIEHNTTHSKIPFNYAYTLQEF